MFRSREKVGYYVRHLLPASGDQNEGGAADLCGCHKQASPFYAVLGGTARDPNEAETWCWAARRTLLCCLRIEQAERRLSSPESLSAGSKTKNNAVVS